MLLSQCGFQWNVNSRRSASKNRLENAAIVFRKSLWNLTLELTNSKGQYSSKLKFLLTSTVISAPIGFGIYIGVDELTQVAGSLFMIFVGVAMLVTGLVQLRYRVFNDRPASELNFVDGIVAGLLGCFEKAPDNAAATPGNRPDWIVGSPVRNAP